MGGGKRSHEHGKGKKGTSRKSRRHASEIDGNHSGRDVSGGGDAHGLSKWEDDLVPKSSFVRKPVDPATAKYFSEIANLFESNEVELEERPFICGNALEEAIDKEFELATDYVISHILQTLLEGCNVDHLCGFLRNSASVFPLIAMDKSGSHVVETALKSLVFHLQDDDTYSTIEETLMVICKEILKSPADLMCSCYGSHVLRRLLCLCKGVSVDASEFNGVKSSASVAERFNLKASKPNELDSEPLGPGFPGLLQLLTSGLVKCVKENHLVVQADRFGSLVLQTVMKLLAGNDETLMQIISALLSCDKEKITEGECIDEIIRSEVLNLVRETSYSHLFEVIFEVAPEKLSNEIFGKVFKNSLLETSSNQSGSFVIQALISNTRSLEQIELIWEELGSKLGELLHMGRSGVVACLVTACHRLNTLQHKCCQALAAAVCSGNESPAYIVPRLLFLDNYISCSDQSSWKWPSGVRMHVMGSLILQAVFRLRHEHIQPFIVSITSIEADQILEAAKDSTGGHVIEAFLDSSASGKYKSKVILKLKGHFGELAMHRSGSFAVEKCFTVSNLTLRETIVSELSSVLNELSKTKHGPHLVRKLDIHGYASRPEQWKSKQVSKQSVYNDFCAIFGSGEAKTPKNVNARQSIQAADIKQLRKEIDQSLGLGIKRNHNETKTPDQKQLKSNMDGVVRDKKRKTEKDRGDDEVKSKKASQSIDTSKKKIGLNNRSEEPSKKKQRP
ncbi:hypothetical protein MLD38_031081 [Melastoma candidum]|uniref:Uncharacterized protein n=1 Tax=Melastoma candidum TaxID=119954 RepID=A0ACB9MPV3_9MYRT|nr:hypothetical protein MLD38_031081 [Melastoma candidum]